MKIPENLREKWRALRSSQDVRQMVQSAADKGLDYSVMSFYRALNTGECSDGVFVIIASFYEQKEARIQAFINKV